MTMSARLWAPLTVAMLALATPALAKDVPADANKALWCASAFTVVEPQARSHGQVSAADNFLKYAKALDDASHASLSKAGFSDDEIKAEGPTYTDKVTKELTGGGTAEFSVIECTQLVDPSAAALIKATGPDGKGTTAAPAAAAPAAPATPAPAAPSK